jgi:uncharacterized LabA/DUF88 family protein
VTLRFFRRKPVTGEEIEVDMAQNDEEEAGEAPTTRRRRAGSTASNRRAATTRRNSDKPATAAPTTSDSKASGSRTRRGRRGGAARKAAAKDDGANITPLFEPPATTDDLLAQQAKLMDSQLHVLKGLQGALSAIETRLGALTGRSEQPRVAIFVDVPNVMYAAQRMKVTLDFKKVLDFLVRGRELVRASAYAPISDDPKEQLETQRFVQPFVDLGYRVVTKPHKRYADGSMKANFDVELAIDVLTMSDRLDTVTLVSGDGDFRRLVELVASKGVRVEVVAFQQSMASELRAVADESIDLDDHIRELRA